MQQVFISWRHKRKPRTKRGNYFIKGSLVNVLVLTSGFGHWLHRFGIGRLFNYWIPMVFKGPDWYFQEIGFVNC